MSLFMQTTGWIPFLRAMDRQILPLYGATYTLRVARTPARTGEIHARFGSTTSSDSRRRGFRRGPLQAGHLP